ncbi:MAG: TolC family protein [Ignavibacteriaceae bacterium]
MRLILFIILFSTLRLFGQDTLVLNLEKSIELAIKHNHDLKLARLDKAKADEQVDEAWGSSVLPNISGNVDYNRAIKRGVIIIDAPGFSGSFPQGTENTLTFGATLEQPLFTGAVFLAVRVAKTYADIQSKLVNATEADVIVNTKNAYYSVLLAKDVLELSRLNQNLAQENRVNTETMFKAGVVPEYDFLRARVQEKNLIPEVQQAENSLVLAENLLKYVTGLELNQPVKVNDSLVLKELPLPEYDDSKNQMLSGNFTLKGLELQIALQDDNVSYQFTKHFPELYLNGSWQAQAQEDDPRSFNAWRYNNSVYFGLNLKVPLFDGFQTTSRVQQAEIDLLIAQEEYDKTVKLLKNSLQDVLLSIDQKREQIDAYESTIEEAQLAYDISIKRYSSGVGTQLETIDAMVALSRAKVNYYTSIYDYYVLHAQLDQLLANNSADTNN